MGGYLKKAKNALKKAPGVKQAMGAANKSKGFGLGLAKKTASAPVSLLSKKPGLGMAASLAKKPMGMAQGAMGRGLALGRKAMSVTPPEKIAAGVAEKMKVGMGKGLALGKKTAPGQMKKMVAAPASKVKEVAPMGMTAFGGRKLRKPSV